MNYGFYAVFLGASLLVPTLGAAPVSGQTSTSEQTAGQGKNDKRDLQLARHIRRDVVKDKSLSMDGHNVKIIASDGNVTLRGAVRSDEEKKTIEGYAQKYVGSGTVDDQLTVKNDTSK